ncbi:hypothetical protein C0583_03600 [Candidatus Parcubacteria bacterium]|nr:MAG: hypothetical protein C0583_03600 [Candidatus Parcubacteria bacterium]
MMSNQDLLALLVDKKIIDETKAKILFEKSNSEQKTIEEIVVNDKIIDEEALTELKAKHYSLPYVNLIEVKITGESLNTFTSEVSQNYNIVCFENLNKQIKVGILDPGNFKAIEAIDFLAKGNGLKVQYYLISKKSFKEAFKQYKSFSKEINTALEKRRDEGATDDSSDEETVQEANDITKSAPVVKIVSVILRHAVEGGASDIHIEPIDKESRVRYRIDGILHTSLVLPKNVHNSIVARVKVLSNMKLDETRIPQDGRIKMKVGDRAVDFRVSTLPLVGTEKVVMRILYTDKGAPKLEELGYLGEQLKIINSCTEQTEGIILATVPTGSGKSTTLFSLIGILNKESVNISTLEDPVEYQIKGISQSQIKPEIGYTFATGLRSFLRQDTDIIMVGEIRDEETAELSIHAALTGHLVLSTVHTTSALGAIARLKDMDVEEFLLGSSLNTIIAQRLVRRICSDCKEEYEPPQEALDEIKEELKEVGDDYLKSLKEDFDWSKVKFYKGKGCSNCANSGYGGRICVSEVIEITDNLKRILLEGKNIFEEDIKKEQKYTTIKQDGFIKVLLGYTTMEEVLRVMRD